jgi:hypothetical protein
VGFIPVEFEDTDQKELEKNKDLPKRIYKKWELLEYSAVPIPSCPEALTLAIEKNMVPESMKKALDKYIEVEDFQEEVEIENEVQTMTSDELKEFYRSQAEIEVELAEGYEANAELDLEVVKDEDGEDEPDLQDAVNELVEAGGVDVEDLTFDDLEGVEEKRFDLEGNPSVWDIMDAISSTIRTPMNSKTWRYVTDLYPVKYPDGHVIIEESSEKTERKYFLHPYEYDGGKIKLGESKELEATYQPKERDIGDRLTTKIKVLDMPEIQEILKSLENQVIELKEGRVLSRKNRGLVKSCTEALLELLKADAAGSREDEDKNEDEDEKETEVDIVRDVDTNRALQRAFEKAIKPETLQKAIELSIKKLQGKVE